ncbi:MAG: helix-turn-helix domain-containing protein, partial [candidate division Zixibacteria bacterium]|nr:helix-turn-helix domain-containing protein [candidate division Zixibacteria bacterium]
MIEFASEGDMLTVGKLLKNERERQELTFEDIADRTKINVKYIKAIEEDRKSQFPGD